MICEKCNGESRINAYGEVWCRDCYMLVYACKCNLKKENNSHKTTEEYLEIKYLVAKN